MNFEVMGLIHRKAFGSPTRKQVIQMMAFHVNEVAEPFAWPSAERLGLRCEIHERTVRRTWQELETAGVISRAGEKKFRGGAVIVWRINLRAIMALPDAVPSIESELESEPDLLCESGLAPPDNLSAGKGEPPDTVSKTPGHSVQDPRAQCPTNNSIELSTESSIPRETRGGPLGVILEELWNAGPQGTRTKSSRKDLQAAVERVLKKRADITAPALLDAYRRYLKSSDVHREGGRYAMGVHRWIGQHRFDAFIGPPGLLAKAAPTGAEVNTAAMAERLDAAFWRFSRTGEWHGARDGWPLKPTQAPPGRYPAELYAKYGLKPLAAPASDQSSEEAA